MVIFCAGSASALCDLRALAEALEDAIGLLPCSCLGNRA